MIINNQERRIKFGHQRFFWSIVKTIFLISLYFFGLHLIPAPESHFLLLQQQKAKLFSGIIDCYLQVNFAVSLFSMISRVFSSNKNTNNKSFNDSISRISRLARPIFFITLKLLGNWGRVANSWYLILLVIFSAFSSISALEIVLSLLNEHGVCNGFDLIFLIEKFPLYWVLAILQPVYRVFIGKGQFLAAKKDFFRIFALSVISILFVLISNLKYRLPVALNKMYSSESKILYVPTFDLKARFNFITVTYLSYLVRILLSWWSDLSDASDTFNHRSFRREFISISSSRHPFLNLYQQIQNTTFLLSLFSWLALFTISNLFGVLFLQLNPTEISKELARMGVYFDAVYPEAETKKLLNRLISTSVTLWTICSIALAICFDNFVIIDHHEFLFFRGQIVSQPSFTAWFLVLGTITDIYEQAGRKYEQVKFYD